MWIHALMAVVALSTSDMPAPLLDDFSSGRYHQMIERVDSLLAQSAGLTLPELGMLHIWKGFGQAALGERQAARASFGVALSLEPSLELDPRDVSPKILTEFEAAKSARVAASPAPPTPTYLVVEDSRPTAALRSMIVPGWGQWSMGRKTRGAVFAIAGLSTLTGWVVADKWENDTHQRYLAAVGPDISSLYDSYNRAYKTHRFLGYGVLALWAGAVADVLLGPTVSVRVIGTGATLGITAGLSLP